MTSYISFSQRYKYYIYNNNIQEVCLQNAHQQPGKHQPLAPQDPAGHPGLAGTNTFLGGQKQLIMMMIISSIKFIPRGLQWPVRPANSILHPWELDDFPWQLQELDMKARQLNNKAWIITAERMVIMIPGKQSSHMIATVVIMMMWH